MNKFYLLICSFLLIPILFIGVLSFFRISNAKTINNLVLGNYSNQEMVRNYEIEFNAGSKLVKFTIEYGVIREFFWPSILVLIGVFFCIIGIIFLLLSDIHISPKHKFKYTSATTYDRCGRA